MRLHYGLEEAGWATVTLALDNQNVRMTASYLHDSLRDLASAAIAIARGAPEAHVIFMDEPGEHELIMRRCDGEAVELEILWYDDWKSWKMFNGPGQRKLLGRTTLAQIRGQVLSELRRLFQENGGQGYKKRWVEHDFPVAQMQELEALAL